MPTPVDPISLIRINEFQKTCETGNDDQRWDALAELVPHLDQDLVEIENTELEERGFARLCVFKAKDQEQSQLYCVASGHGCLILGKVDALKQNVSLYMEDYDPQWDQIGTFFVTDKMRFGGKVLDAIVVVHRCRPEEQETHVMYHAEIAFNGGLHLNPANDDNDLTSAKWNPTPADRMPEWFKKWAWFFEDNISPMETPPSHWLQKLDEIDQNRHGQIDTVLRTQNHICISHADEIILLDKDPSKTPNAKQLYDWLRALALFERNDKVFTIIGRDDRHLTGTEFSDIRKNRSFDLFCTQLTSAIAFCKDLEQDSSWPDFLILHFNGVLKRLRRPQSHLIRNLWDQLWSKLNLTTYDALLPKQKVWKQSLSPQQRRALLRHVVTLIYNNQNTQKRYGKELSEWLHQGDKDAVFDEVVEYLIGQFERPLDECWQECSYQIEMIDALYHSRFNLKVQDRIDRFVGSHNLMHQEGMSETLTELINNAKVNRDDLRRDHQDPKNPTDAIEQGKLELEAWPNAFWMSEAIRLKELRAAAMVNVIGLPGAGDFGHLVLVTRREILLYAFDSQRRLQRQAHKKIALPRNERIQKAIRFSNTRIIVAGVSGKLYIYRWNGMLKSLGLFKSLTTGMHGSAWALTLCCEANHPTKSHVVAVFNKDRTSHTVNLEANGDAIRCLKGKKLNIPKVHFVDLAHTSNGYILAKASSAASQSAILFLDSESLEESRVKDSLFEVETGAQGICFDKPNNPKFCLLGDRLGFVWCFEERQGHWNNSNHLWLHRFLGGVRCIATCTYNGESHFLVGTEAGELAMLRARDGSRVWKRRLFAPVRGIHNLFPKESSHIAVAMTGGWLAIYNMVEMRDKALQHARKCCQYLDENTTEEERKAKHWVHEDTHSLRFLFKRERLNKDYFYILNKLKSPEARMRVMRYLALKEHEKPFLDIFVEIRAQLTFKELYLLCFYLPENTQLNVFWVMWETIKKRLGDGLETVDCPKAQAAAASICIQRLSKQRLDSLQIQRLDPGSKLLEDEWVRYELARLWLRSVPYDKRNGKGVFQELIEVTYNYPIQMLDAFVKLCRYEKARQDFQHFRLMIKQLPGNVPFAENGMLKFAKTLIGFRNQKSLSGLLYWCCRLVCYFEEVTDKTHWEDKRDNTLSALKKIHDITFKTPTKPGTPFATLLSGLQTILHQDCPPFDIRSLNVRQQYWEQFANLAMSQRDELEVSGKTWSELARLTAHKLKRLFTKIAQWEIELIKNTIRPKLSLENFIPKTADMVEVVLLLKGEGQKRALNVELSCDASIPGGLLPSGKRIWKTSQHAFDAESRAQEIRLSGHLEPDQTQIKIRVRMKAKGRKSHEVSWDLDIGHFKGIAKRSELNHQFPKNFEYLTQELKVPKQKSTIFILDGSNNQRHFAQAWRDHHQALFVDLDQTLKNHGPGKTYASEDYDGSSTRETIKRHVRNALTARGIAVDATRIIFACMNHFEARCREHKQDAYFNRIWSFLCDPKSFGSSPQLILTDSTIIQRLRGLPSTEACDEIAAHALLRDTWQESLVKYNSPGKETISWIENRLENLHRKHDPNPKAILELLNYDIRRLQAWLSWQVDHPHQNLSNYLKLKSTRIALIEEMASFGSKAVILLMLGSVAKELVKVSSLQVGFVASQHIQSQVTGTGSQKKDIIKPGQRLEPRQINNLHTLKIQTIRVEGFGLGRPVNTDPNLHRIAQSLLSENERQQLLKKLKDMGLMEWNHNLARTSAPYKNLILNLYKSVTTTVHHDVGVYQAILGKHRIPLEGLSLKEVHHTQSLRLFDKARPRELHCIKELAKLWKPEEEPELEVKLAQLLDLQSTRDASEAFSPLNTVELPIFIKGFKMAPGSFWIWWHKDNHIDLDDLVSKCKKASNLWVQSRQQSDTNDENLKFDIFPKIFIFGPKADAQEPDNAYRVAYVKQADFIQATWSGNLEKGLNRCARRQLRMDALSPFQLGGPLPPGSTLFKGRSKELNTIVNNIRKQSALIVGSRRVGKTSLLYQILAKTQDEPDLCPIFVDLQNRNDRDDFSQALKSALSDENNRHIRNLKIQAELGNSSHDLKQFCQLIKSKKRTPVFLLNEVDGLAKNCPSLMVDWRHLNEAGNARFILVGYAVLASLSETNSPFNHFTQGNDFDRKATSLAALTPEAAHDILDLLTSDELGLQWVSVEDREKAHQLCLRRSYRIPWVLQRFGHLILERLQERRQDELSYDLVEDALSREGEFVWSYITSINYRKLGFENDEKYRDANPYGFKIILYALVRDRYILSEKSPIRDPYLEQRRALEKGLAFTTEQAKNVVENIMDKLLTQNEHRQVRIWFESLDLVQVLRHLTLTLVLELDPNDGNRFGFLMHILPKELWQKYQYEDANLDNLILEQATHFINYLKGDVS